MGVASLDTGILLDGVVPRLVPRLFGRYGDRDLDFDFENGSLLVAGEEDLDRDLELLLGVVDLLCDPDLGGTKGDPDLDLSECRSGGGVGLKIEINFHGITKIISWY